VKVLKILESVSRYIDVKVEEGLFGGPDDPLAVLASRLAEKIIAERREHGLPLKAIRVTRPDLPDEEDDGSEIVFRLKLACGPREAFDWLKHLSYREYEIDQSLTEDERELFASIFRIAIDWEKRP